ncbi:hypothetical protein JKP88DRAFT_276500 [Tribonema minus]|uniref:PARP n=1 Tax=Tribonema minus TaxID=303371 RepID=A0A836CHI6_9STRA|nr:hypothetical protein JKP88DRAFT_276500 [Tribonema minus]
MSSAKPADRRLTRARARDVTEVHAYECGAAVTDSFNAKKSELQSAGKSTDEAWVFHATHRDNIPAIMCTGFRVCGSGAAFPVLNGSAHGYGVYAASGPPSINVYANEVDGTKAVILARALKGQEGERGQGDRWGAGGNWRVFRSGAQLLPCYVVYYVADAAP